MAPARCCSSAAAGESQRHATVSRPSGSTGAAATDAATKKRASYRRGRSSGVIQRAQYAMRSVASVSPSVRSMARNAAASARHRAR